MEPNNKHIALYKKIREITEPYHVYSDQMMAVSIWIDMELLAKSEEKNNAWIETKNKMPKPGIPVIACGLNEYGKLRRIRAAYFPKHFKIDDSGYIGDSDYCEEKKEYYWPEGWYEWNEFDETSWSVGIDITHWMPLPEPPKELK
jgi:hypothetical protein